MATKRKKMIITYLDEDGIANSIIQEMSKHFVGSWIWFFLDNGYRIIDVSYINEI